MAIIFLKLIERIRATIPGVAIRTSMIVGFPGETDADFETLCQFVEAAQFDRLGVFSYSDEDSSASFQPGRQSGRAHHLQSQAAADGDCSGKFRKARNRDADRPRSSMCWSKAHRPIPICLASAPVHPGARDRRRLLHFRFRRESACAPARFRRMRITEAHDYDLTGELIDALPR